MLKNILKLNGAQELSKIEQKAINGEGAIRVTTCNSYRICPSPINGVKYECRDGYCQPIAFPNNPLPTLPRD